MTKRGRGRPCEHIVTEETRKVVFNKARVGAKDVDIGALLHTSEQTLRRRYSDELRRGRAQGRLDLATAVHVMAVGVRGEDGKYTTPPNPSTLRFAARCRLVMNEPNREVVHVSPPLQLNVPEGSVKPVLIVPGILDPTRWAELAKIHAQAVLARAHAPVSEHVRDDGSMQPRNQLGRFDR